MLAKQFEFVQLLSPFRQVLTFLPELVAERKQRLVKMLSQKRLIRTFEVDL